MVGASGPPRPSVDELAAWSRPARQAAIEALFAIDDAPHKPLAAALCATDRDDVRLDLSQAFARLKPDGFVIAVAVCLARGDAQVVSLVARQVAERSAQLEAFTQDVVVERLLAARARFVSPLVTETVDDALLASSSPSAFTDLVARLGSLSPRIGAKVIVRLLGQSDDELEVIGPRVVDAVVHNRRLYLGAARLLVRVCGVMGARRARLFHAGVAILADDTVSLGDKLTALTVVDVAFVWPIAVELDVFLQLLEVAVGEPRLTVVRLLGRMGTEDAARELVKLAASSEAEVAGAAVAALASWLSPLVDVKRNDDDGQWVITPTYLDDVGVPLVLTSHAIHHPTTHQVYALDERGLVVPIGSSDDACACCERPRRWVVRAGRRVCPRTREVQPGSSSSLELHHAITDDPRPVAPPTVAPGVAELAALRAARCSRASAPSRGGTPWHPSTCA
jgi:HEAT repeat protein